MKIVILIICLVILYNLLLRKQLEHFKNDFGVDNLCKMYKNKNIDLIITGGNKGDGLIYEGLFNYLKKYNINYNIINNSKPKKNIIYFLFQEGEGLAQIIVLLQNI